MSIIGEVENVAEEATGTGWLKLWPYAMSILALVGLLYSAYSWSYARGVHSRDAEVAALNLTIANMKTASAQATAANLKVVHDTATKYAAIQKENSDAIDAKSVAANSAVDAYIRLHPAPKANPGNAGSSAVSQAANATGSTPEAGPDTEVYADDLRVCAANTIAAEGWQAWWGDVSSEKFPAEIGQ